MELQFLLKKREGILFFLLVALCMLASTVLAVAEDEFPKPKANGEQCAFMGGGPITEEMYKEADAKCKSGSCFPGPGKGGINIAWYCVASSMNCAVPGLDGVRFGAQCNVASGSLTCMNTGAGRGRCAPK